MQTISQHYALCRRCSFVFHLNVPDPSSDAVYLNSNMFLNLTQLDSSVFTVFQTFEGVVINDEVPLSPSKCDVE